MKKFTIPLAVLILFVTIIGATVAEPSAQTEEGQIYIVQANDWLSKLADKFYSDMFAWPAIQIATNAKSETDDSFTFISDPNLIEIGQKLWIPSETEATSILTNEDSTDTSTTTKTLVEMPGRLVDVGGHKLHINCIGQGSPTVVVITGLGHWSTGWQPIQADISNFTRICVYDRAGYAWSDPGPLERSIQQNVDELKALLINSGEQGPFIFVAHSLGGYYIRLFYKQNPDMVAGVVLVNAAPPEFNSTLAEKLPDIAAANEVDTQNYLNYLAENAEKLRVSGFTPDEAVNLAPNATDLSWGYHQERLAHYLEAVRSELKYAEEHALQELQDISYGDTPLTVIVAGFVSGGPFDDDTMQAIFEVWANLQEEQKALSTNGNFLVAEKSAHLIYIEQPEIVIDSIRQMLETNK